LSDIPKSQLARTSVVGATALKIGLGKLKTKTKRPFLSREQQSADQEALHDKEAQILFSAITQLRGTAVKLAQQLGMESELLPERVRNELARSYHQVPPLNRVLVSKVISEDLGKRPEKLFKSFNPSAIAAASLGQVHRAELHNGNALAIKVQYPGIRLTIDSDLKLLRKIAPGALKFLPEHARPTKNVLDKSITEIDARLKEETNYRLEAKNTLWFGENLHVDGVSIPKVMTEYCSEKVLTTELLSGLHLDEWLATDPPQHIRNLAAQRIQDVFVKSILELHRIHADPNPGNYLFQPDGTVGLIDFGCVKVFSKQFVDNLPALLLAFYEGDLEKILNDYEAIGVVIAARADIDFGPALLVFRDWLVEPFLVERFDFKKHKDYSNRGNNLMHKLSEVPVIEKIQEDFIFFQRTTYGLFKIFERLEATVDLRSGWNLPEIP